MKSGGWVNQTIFKRASASEMIIRFPVFTFRQLQISDRRKEYFCKYLPNSIVTGDYSLSKNVGEATKISIKAKDGGAGYTEYIQLPKGVRLRLASITDSTSGNENQVLMVLDAKIGKFVIESGHGQKTKDSHLYIFIEDFSPSFGVRLFEDMYLVRESGTSVQGIINAQYRPAFPEQELMK
jgi:hypothetical protein